MTILPCAYFPSVAYFAAILRGDAVIDLGEHYIKRSERNRAVILTAAGEMQLTAQVKHANRPRQPMHCIELDYSKRWQKQHWGALVAAYKGSPFFDHYAPRFQPFFEREWATLVELNLALLAELCAILGLKMPEVSTHYVTATDEDIDMRPKQKDSAFYTEPYVQVFADRQPFVGNLSIIDLLFTDGPAAVATLKCCRPAR